MLPQNKKISKELMKDILNDLDGFNVEFNEIVEKCGYETNINRSLLLTKLMGKILDLEKQMSNCATKDDIIKLARLVEDGVNEDITRLEEKIKNANG